jgi:hypothetical protein
MNQSLIEYNHVSQSFRRVLDTNPSKSRSYKFNAASRTRAVEVAQMASDEIVSGNLHVAETDSFLDKLFPIPSTTIDTVYQTLVDNTAYDPLKKQWKGLPKTETKESVYYKPFVKAAEAIRTAYAYPESASLTCRWIDRPNISPKSLDPRASLIRPDVLCILGTDDTDDWEQLIDDKDEVRLGPLLG